MSVPSTEQVTGAPVTEATNNAIEDAEKHTKDGTPEVPAPPANTPSDPSDSNDGIKELREQVGVLGETVETLSKAVETALAAVTGQRDESVAKVPFLLRGKQVKGE